MAIESKTTTTTTTTTTTGPTGTTKVTERKSITVSKTVEPPLIPPKVGAQTLALPVIDLAPYLADPSSAAALAECAKAADALVQYSALSIRDPRVSEQNNTDFLDLMEDYFDQPTETKLNDARPEIGFQVGSTPDNTELPRCGRDDECLAAVADMAPEDQPGQFDTPDPKWRFFHRMGEVPPYETKFPALNAAPVVPAAFPNWVNDMDKWGNLLLTSVDTLSEMVAVGFGLPKDTFTKLTKYAPHLLAPTGSDLSLYGKVGTVLAGFHADLNFLTIHGKSRFPGLHIWTRAGKKMLAAVADGCLLVQAGRQLEYLTGGHVAAGFHEVLIVESTLKAIERQQAKNRPLWRISSTLFYHVASDNELAPLEKFATPENVKQFPPILTGTQVQKELGFLNLASE